MSFGGLSVASRLRLIMAVFVGALALVSIGSALLLVRARTDYDDNVNRTLPTYIDVRAAFEQLSDAEDNVHAGLESGDRRHFAEVGRTREANARTESRISAALAGDEAVAGLLTARDEALESWWSHVDDVMAATTSGDAFDDSLFHELEDELHVRFDAVGSTTFALANSLRARLESDIAETSAELGDAARWTVAIAAAAAVFSVGTALRTSSVLVRPLVRLRDLTTAVRSSARDVRADETTGPREVRDLARAFNGSRAAVEQDLDIRELLLEITTSMRHSDTFDDAVAGMCARLGTALDADRCLLFSDRSGEPWEFAHSWSRPGRPPIGEIDEQWRRRATAVASHGVASRGLLAIDDVTHAPELGETGIAVAEALQVRAVVSAPLYIGDRVGGILAVTMDDRPRQWNDVEVHAVRQAASYTSQAAAEREYIASLRALDRQKSEFLSTASHELRTPLASIAGYVEMFEDGDFGELAADQHKALGVISRNTRRLRNLVDDILILNRIETRGLAVEFTTVAVGDVLASVYDELEPIAAASGVTIECPDPPVDAQVRGDRDALERAISNVLGNALKFTPRGGRASVECEIVAGDDGMPRVRVRCTDTGIGIPASELADISSRFFRASNATDLAIPGTGLGLAIVRRIVECHEGTFAIESVHGEGTIVTLELPLLADEPTGTIDPP